MVENYFGPFGPGLAQTRTSWAKNIELQQAVFACVFLFRSDFGPFGPYFREERRPENFLVASQKNMFSGHNRATQLISTPSQLSGPKAPRHAKR